MKFKEFIKTPKGKLTVSLSVLLCSWLFMFWQLSGDLSSWIPNQEKANLLRKKLIPLRKECTDTDKKLSDVRKLKLKYQEKIKNEWNLNRDGDPEVLMPRMITQAAQKAGITLNNFGSVRTNRINNDFCYAELDVSANTSFETVMKFVREVEKLKPGIGWRRFSANVMLRRNNTKNTNSVTSAKTKTQTVDTTSLIFSGTLRVIVYDGNSTGGAK